jgi:hypothetical protein
MDSATRKRLALDQKRDVNSRVRSSRFAFDATRIKAMG